jgi:hypothetical protein
MLRCSVDKKELALHIGIVVSSECSHVTITSTLLMANKKTFQIFYVSLTVHLCSLVNKTDLVHNLFLAYLYLSISTCFG